MRGTLLTEPDPEKGNRGGTEYESDKQGDGLFVHQCQLLSANDNGDCYENLFIRLPEQTQG